MTVFKKNSRYLVYVTSALTLYNFTMGPVALYYCMTVPGMRQVITSHIRA